jgi:hypothetical protein
MGFCSSGLLTVIMVGMLIEATMIMVMMIMVIVSWQR